MPETPSLEVTYLPVRDLVPYANNSKIHTEEQIAQIASSIERFGDCDPIGVWHDPSGKPVIVEGHGRMLALEQLGIDEAPVIFLDHLSDEDRRAYSHVHNQTTLSSGLDDEVLLADVDELGDLYDWQALGFDIPDVDDFTTDFELRDTDAPLCKTATLNMTLEQFNLFTATLDAMDDPGGGGNVAANKVCEVLAQWAGR